jgi:hypothetical protein
MVKIAEIGLFISSFNSINLIAFLSQCLTFAFKNEIGIDSNVASTKEHKKEKMRAVKR